MQPDTGKLWQRRVTGSPAMRRPVPGQRPLGLTARCRRGQTAADRVPGWATGDGPQSGQTVRPGSRTCRYSMLSANLSANTHTRRQRNDLASENVQRMAEINLPVDSPTYIRAQLVKQSSVARRTCMPYVKSWSPVRVPVPAQPCARPACEGVWQGEDRRARRPRGGAEGCGEGGRRWRKGAMADSN
jgi:hypothetical protein